MKSGKKNHSKKLAFEIPALGSFVSIPDAFPESNPSVRNVVKFEFTTMYSDFHRIQTLFSSDRVLVDLSAVDASQFDFQKLVVDCDLIKEISTKYSDEIIEIITGLQEGGASGIQKAQDITEKIGLTEKNFIKSGGGFFFLIAVAVAAAAAGGCATLNSNKPFKQPTTPQPDNRPRPQDAGTGDGGTPQ